MIGSSNPYQAGQSRPPASGGRPRLLYLGNALPPGVSNLFPECQPAGHLVETSMVQSVEPWFEVRSVGCSGLNLDRLPPPTSESLGLPNVLNLTDRPPEVFYRRRSLGRLQRAYRRWLAEGWRPDVILVCNLSPIYDGFIRWLKHQPSSPLLALYLADSSSLGMEVAWSKRLRYRFKPLVFPEIEMIKYFDACAAVSPTAEQFFSPRGVPWFWLPNGCEPKRALRAEEVTIEGPVRFGYVGSLGAHAGLPDLLKVFTSKQRNSVLHICGFGKARTEIAEACGRDPRLEFHQPRTPDGCLQLGRTWDVLINPRPIRAGNQNNFPSKIFEYALSGRAILSSRVSGADVVLGPEAYYFDEHNFALSLDRSLDELANTQRQELNRRGTALQQRLLSRFSWAQQGERLAGFLKQLLPA